jgi:hypothetical protein
VIIRQTPEMNRKRLMANEVGCAEAEVGRYVYRLIEARMDALIGTPEYVELDYLSALVADVEEYGADELSVDELRAAPGSPHLTWPFGFYDSHTAAERLETLAKLFEQPVEDKLTGRVAIAEPLVAASDIRDVLAQVASLREALEASQHAEAALRREATHLRNEAAQRRGQDVAAAHAAGRPAP